MDEASATETIDLGSSGTAQTLLESSTHIDSSLRSLGQCDCEASTSRTRAIDRLPGGSSARNTSRSFCRLLANL